MNQQLNEKSITKNLMCIKLYSGVEIWVEKEKAEKLINLIGTTQTKFIEIGNEVINSSSVEGVFNPATMEDLSRRSRGMWLCDKGLWHDKNEKCFCGLMLKNYE